MPSRTQITLDSSLDRRAKQRAQELGISFAEYVRRVITEDLADHTTHSSIIELAGIGDSHNADIATQKDQYLNEAFDR